MLVLTLKQPYAWMVIHGSKDIENRSWVNALVNHLITRGESFAIHAGVSVRRDYYEQAVAYARTQDPELRVPAREDLVLGAILGTVVPTEVFRPEDWLPARRWHMRGQYGWALRDRTALPVPIPAKGKQGFWSVDDELIARAA